MTGRVYVRDLEVLHNLDEGLSKFNYGAISVLEQVARGIKASKEHLRSRTSYWQIELRRREDTLRACENARDDKGRGYDCRAEATAVRQAHESLEKLQKLSSRLEQAIGEYTPYASRLQQLSDTRMGKAKGDLHRSTKKYQDYLAHASTTSAITSSTLTGNLTAISHNSSNSFGTTLQPGPFAQKYIPARSHARDFTSRERQELDRIGRTSGCHTCGTKEPGAKHFVPDHQPPSQLHFDNNPQRLYPQCLSCSRKQGGEVNSVENLLAWIMQMFMNLSA